MSPAPRRCSPPPSRPGSRASSTSVRSPRASPTCRSTARARRGPKRWSKASPLSTAIVRPPPSTARATAKRSTCSRWPSAGWSLLPPAGRLSLIHVDDLARLLLALAAERRRAADRARRWPPGGSTHREFGQALGRAVGRRVRTLSLPRPLLRFGARPTGWFAATRPSSPPTAPPISAIPTGPFRPTAPRRTLWQPGIDAEAGPAATARWYREARLALDPRLLSPHSIAYASVQD